MLKLNRIPIILALLAALMLAGCRDLGSVEQGLVVAYDEGAGQLTLILDSNPTEPTEPRYDRVPPVVVSIPPDPSQMGPAPAAGGFISVDTESHKVVVYDYAAKQLKTITYEPVNVVKNVYPDDSRLADGAVPKIDKSAKQVTFYCPRSREIVTATVPEDALNLSAESWEAGDEIRYYFKDPAQALRMMNVSRTKIS